MVVKVHDFYPLETKTNVPLSKGLKCWNHNKDVFLFPAQQIFFFFFSHCLLLRETNANNYFVKTNTNVCKCESLLVVKAIYNNMLQLCVCVFFFYKSVPAGLLLFMSECSALDTPTIQIHHQVPQWGPSYGLHPVFYIKPLCVIGIRVVW